MSSVSVAEDIRLAMSSIHAKVHNQSGVRGFRINSSTIQGAAYQVYEPKMAKKGRKVPLIMFLHGAGERGQDSLLAVKEGIGPAIQKFPDRFPAVVAFPQCPKKSWWSSARCVEIFDDVYKDVLANYKIDRSRVYLTGLSMGGYGVWLFAEKYPHDWAALLSVSGRSKPAHNYPAWPQSIADRFPGKERYRETAKALSYFPLYIVHGEKDPVVPVEESRKIAKYLRGLDLDFTYDELKGRGHNIWDDVYQDESIISWLFNHRLGSSE